MPNRATHRHLRAPLAELALTAAGLGVLAACGNEGANDPTVTSSANTTEGPGAANPVVGGTAGPSAEPPAPATSTANGAGAAGPNGNGGSGAGGHGAGNGGNGPGTAGGAMGTAGSEMSAGGSSAGGSGPDTGGTAGAGGADLAGGSGGNTGGAGVPLGGSGGTMMNGSAGSAGDSSGGAGGAEGDLCDVGVWDGSVPEPLDLSGSTFAHDPTMVEANGTYYRFWTGNGIPSATSTDLVEWEDAPAVFSDGYSPWVNDWLAGVPGQTFNFPWAPDASYFNGQFHIYSSFSARFGDNISCITHLTSDGPTPGNWTDQGPVICTEGNEPYNAIDADVGLDAEGNPYLAFGSFWDGLMAFPLNADGSRLGSELTRLAWAREIEAPVLFRRCGYYYLFVTWGLCCPGEGRSVDDLSYRVAVGRSENILGPYVDRDGTPMLEGGGTLLVEGDGVQWAAAGHSDVIVAGSRIYHFYHAYRQSNGQAQLRIVELPFDDEGWPVPGGP